MVKTGDPRTPAVTKAVVPAAGLETRFLPVVDKPAIQYVVEEAVASGELAAVHYVDVRNEFGGSVVALWM